MHNTQSEEDNVRAQHVANLMTGMAPMIAPASDLPLNVSLQPSYTTVLPDQPILASISLGDENIGPAQMRYILCALQGTHSSLGAITRDNGGVSQAIWDRCEEPHEEGNVTMTDYARDVFGSVSPASPRTMLFTASAVPSIDTITWNLVQARCVHHPTHAVCERLCEMAVLLTGEQWCDLWSSQEAQDEIHFLIFGNPLQAWYLRATCERALPILLDPGLLENVTSRRACHILGATLQYLATLRCASPR